jgi:hypothetical protein
MRRTFNLEIDVVLDADAVPRVIELARQCYAGAIATSVDGPGATRDVPAEEYIDGIDDALMKLLERNPLLANTRVEVERVSCSTDAEPCTAGLGPEIRGPYERTDSALDRQLGDDELDYGLDDLGTGLYLCRWPNGDFSLVKADSRNYAVVQLDEWAGAEPDWLMPVETCMIDFRLNDRAEIELAKFGDKTDAFVWKSCYPVLNEGLSSEEVLGQLNGKDEQETAERIKNAVKHERERLSHLGVEVSPSTTALGQDLQRRLGTVGVVADHYVAAVAKEMLKGKAGAKGKRN